jgi:hypothetical protein
MLKHHNLDKFELQSTDGVFLGYALHYHAYHVLTLETNSIMETSEVNFDETSPNPSSIFEHADPDQMGETIFVEEEQDDTD